MGWGRNSGRLPFLTVLSTLTAMLLAVDPAGPVPSGDRLALVLALAGSLTTRGAEQLSFAAAAVAPTPAPLLAVNGTGLTGGLRNLPDPYPSFTPPLLGNPVQSQSLEDR
jgi:hypothetical protein